jgi:choline-glycine betaine transporter
MVEKTLFISGMVMFAMLTTGTKEESASHARIAPVWQILLGIIAILLCVASAHGQVCLD